MRLTDPGQLIIEKSLSNSFASTYDIHCTAGPCMRLAAKCHMLFAIVTSTSDTVIIVKACLAAIRQGMTSIVLLLALCSLVMHAVEL